MTNPRIAALAEALRQTEWWKHPLPHEPVCEDEEWTSAELAAAILAALPADWCGNPRHQPDEIDAAPYFKVWKARIVAVAVAVERERIETAIRATPKHLRDTATILAIVQGGKGRGG